MTRKEIHINCDMGESYGRYTLTNDAALMHLIDACNIACGFHAGDSVVMDRTIKLAIDAGIQIGAHPSYPDMQGFGRRPMEIAEHDLETMIRYQVSAVIGMTRSNGGEVHHVKAHGALYNKAAKSEKEARAIAKAVRSISSELILYAPYQSIQSQIAEDYGLSVYHEAFMDRRYNKDGSLVSRSMASASITEPIEAWHQIKQINDHQKVPVLDGDSISLRADTYCIHGDNPAALTILEFINSEGNR